MMTKRQGWKGEPLRHSMSARGVKSGKIIVPINTEVREAYFANQLADDLNAKIEQGEKGTAITLYKYALELREAKSPRLKRAIKLFEKTYPKEAKNIKTGNFVFRENIKGVHDERTKFVFVMHQGKEYPGFIEYTPKTGIGWDFGDTEFQKWTIKEMHEDSEEYERFIDAAIQAFNRIGD